MKEPQKRFIGQRARRQDRLIRERVHDPYKTRLKLSEPSFCPKCGAVWSKGRWQWAKEQRENAREEQCQACHRIDDKNPAGKLSLSGTFLVSHREEILNLVKNTEKVENEEHPLNRIMAIDEKDNHILILTTDIHLPRRIGQAVFNAYEGEFDFNYDKEGYFVRVNWSRND